MSIEPSAITSGPITARARPGKHAGEDVAAELVRAEPVLDRRRRQPEGEVMVERVIRGDRPPEHREERDQAKHDEADHDEPVRSAAPAGRDSWRRCLDGNVRHASDRCRTRGSTAK